MNLEELRDRTYERELYALTLRKVEQMGRDVPVEVQLRYLTAVFASALDEAAKLLIRPKFLV